MRPPRPRSPARSLVRRVARFLGARAGNATLLFAVLSVPVIGIAGAAMDYSRATRVRTQLQRAVDAAALAGVQVLERSDSEATQRAVDVFRGAAPDYLRTSTPGVTVSPDHVALTVSASGTIPTTLLSVLGLSQVGFDVNSRANRPDKRTIEVYLALDVSASMGLAADEAGRDALRALTGCAFACHEPEGGQTVSNYAVARSNGIKTRFDVLQEQTRNLAAGLLDPSNRNDVRFAIYTVADGAGRALTPPTGTLARVNNGIDQLQLAFNTQFDAALPAILQDMGVQGTGATSASPQKLLFLVTDGVQSYRGSPWESSAFRPIDVPLCTAIKGRGFTVAVLNIRYVPMPTEAPYLGTVARFQDQLAPNLRACASSGFYYEAERPDEIAAGFARFTQALAQFRLSQ